MRALLHSLKDGWMMFAHALGRVNTVIILTLFYFVVLAPIGLCARIIGACKRNPRPQWTIEKPSPVTLESLRRPF